MTPPRVTVLMAVYNGECYLREAIESILHQTFSNFEFLIINDGSTDSSVQIIQSYNDPRIRLVHNQVNMGLATALNMGFTLAHGEYVARMDADDISRPERLAFQVSFMDAHPQIGVCGSWVRFFSKTDSSIWRLPEGSEEIRCWQFHTVGVAHPSVMMRRQFFVQHGFLYDPHYRYSQDYELWGRAIRYMKFANIQKVLLDYRISSGQICALYSAEQHEAIAPLRLQRLHELGVEPTPDLQQLHEMIMNGVLPSGPEQLEQAEQWLIQLESANRETCVYPAQLYSRRLLDIWFSNCVADSSCTLWRCLMSPLWSTIHHSIWHQTRAFGAWIIRKVV